jgi:hypothetical protein
MRFRHCRFRILAAPRFRYFELLQENAMKYRPRLAVLAAALAVVLSACDGATVTSTTAPSLTANVKAAIVQTVPSPPGSVAVPPVWQPCMMWPAGPPTFALMITSGRNTALSHVTLQLIDGSHVGGPMVTFPQPALANEFGSTIIVAGTTRTFNFRPQFGCGPTPVGIVADVIVSGEDGATQTATATTTIK